MTYSSYAHSPNVDGAAEARAPYLYSPWQVTGAALLGGPPAGLWLIAGNVSRLGEAKKAKLLQYVTVLVALALLLWSVYGPHLKSYTVLDALLAIGVREYAKASYGTTYQTYIANGGQRAAHWRWVWAGVVGMLLFLGLVALYVVGLGALAPALLPADFH